MSIIPKGSNQMDDLLPLVIAIYLAVLIALGIILVMWAFGKWLNYLMIWKAAKDDANKVLKRKR